MARVEWAQSAVASLDRLIFTHTLPGDTRERIKTSLRPLARFPRLGPAIARRGDHTELRFVIGPWRWLVIVYLYDETEDQVVVVSVEDGRSAASTLGLQRVR